MISIDLARKLRDAGLTWEPQDGDRFFIPDRDLDEHTFSISEMTVGLRHVPGGAEISFNGAVEWALDAIMKREVVWLPSEGQLRDLLGDAFVALRRDDGDYACDIDDGHRQTFRSDDASNAYGLALLDVLVRDEGVLPRLELDEL